MTITCFLLTFHTGEGAKTRATDGREESSCTGARGLLRTVYGGLSRLSLPKFFFQAAAPALTAADEQAPHEAFLVAEVR